MNRRSGAPRLIEWTGERAVPWSPDVQVVYEHLHRYLWAAQLTKGRRVLDLASGEGFGAAILAESAASVVGIDLDQTSVDHSQLNYGSDKLEFRLGDALDLSGLEESSLGAVIAFEMIEHVDDQARVLEQISRVLEPDGLLIISTPDRRAYTDATGQDNPFHVRELDSRQFNELVATRFAHVRIWGQRTVTGSALSALTESADEGPSRAFFVEREGEDWELAAGLSALYLIAVASNAELPKIPRDSTLADGGVQLLRAAEKAAGAQLRAMSASHEETTRELQTEVGQRDAELQTLRAAIGDREVELELHHQRLADLLEEAQRNRSELALLRDVTARFERSITWKVFERARERVLGAIGGPGSVQARALKRALRGIGGVLLPGRPGALAGLGAPQAWDKRIELPEFDRPDVSIVIPIYSGAEFTRRCLESIRDRTKGVSYEVILADDAADRASKALLASVKGARILVNRRNLGYLRTVNLACSHARGRWVVLCNNDIEAYEGWLSAMVRCGESSEDIGVVTPKYLYPDGSLAEAGAIVWRDGSAGNYGRGEKPSESRYEFRRDVDYGSAAALLVRTELWRTIGGFDERYEPMYYEDTDFCFQARERGYRVVYEPRANVVHYEGGTAGTDLAGKYKRFQDINAAKFYEKWRHRLERDQLRAGPQNARRASNRNRGPHVLIVDHRVPMWDRDSGALRMLGIIRALLGLGCRVTLLPDDLHLVLPYTVDLMSMGVEVLYGQIDVAVELTEVAQDLALIISCRPHTTGRWLDLLREKAPTVPVVYDTVDLHWLREARRATLDDHSKQPALGPKAAALREIELALIRATDATLVVSDEERAQVEADVPEAIVRVLPNVNELTEAVAPWPGRSGVVFIGSFEHTPNIDAAVRLVRGVMPRVWRELADVPVTIIGAEPPAEVTALASPLVDVAGWVRDVEPLLQAAGAMVAPLSWGAGLKGKVTQALAAGLPVITTPIGAEGLDATDGEQMLIGNDDRQLADRVIRALSDAELWAALSRAGQQLAAERCSPAIATERLAELLADRSRLATGAAQVPTGRV